MLDGSDKPREQFSAGRFWSILQSPGKRVKKDIYSAFRSLLGDAPNGEKECH